MTEILTYTDTGTTLSGADDPMVSILIPCFNHEKFIQDTLDSIKRDTYRFKEIIILNDGSTDSSHQKITEWIAHNNQFTRIRYINRENKGICAALNEMITWSRGKYYIPLASDDCLYGNTIAQRVQLMESRPEKFVMLNDAVVIDGDGKQIMESSAEDYWKADKKNYSTEKGILKECIKGPKVGGPVIMIKKKVHNIIGMYPEDLRTEDWYFYQRTACNKMIFFSDLKVAQYRLHKNNFSRVKTPHAKKIAIEIMNIYKRNFRFFPGIYYKGLAIINLFSIFKWYLKLSIKEWWVNRMR